MELQKEFIEKHELNEETVEAINSFYKKQIEEIILPEKELKYDTKYKAKANENAEAILGGAAKSLENKFGYARNEGEKITDYFSRVQDDFSKNLESLKDKSKIDVESKEYIDLKEKHEQNLIKLADFDTLKEKAEKYDVLLDQNDKLKNENAFTSVKPNFSSDANKYEVDAKWNGFKKEILENYNIENVDGEYKAIDKENRHKIKSLSDLVKENESLSSLTGERNQGGLGLQGKNKGVKKDGLPFTLPKNATKAQISASINAQLAKDNVPDSKRNEVFGKYWKIANS